MIANDHYILVPFQSFSDRLFITQLKVLEADWLIWYWVLLKWQICIPACSIDRSDNQISLANETILIITETNIICLYLNYEKGLKKSISRFIFDRLEWKHRHPTGAQSVREFFTLKMCMRNIRERVTHLLNPGLIVTDQGRKLPIIPRNLICRRKCLALLVTRVAKLSRCV